MTDAQAFLQKWSASGAAESSNAQSFTNDLCDLIGVAKPDPSLPDESQNTYVFEKSVPSTRGVKKIDCYKRGYFILENKQGAAGADAGAKLSLKKQTEQKARKTGHGKRGSKAWDTAMERAKKQAENYARLLAAEEITSGRPPFILVADVGHSIAVYADWSRAGGHYQPFPDPNNYRIKLRDLEREDVRERLRLIWTDPLALDPARRSAKVTKQIADRLAALAKSLEPANSSAERYEVSLVGRVAPEQTRDTAEDNTTGGNSANAQTTSHHQEQPKTEPAQGKENSSTARPTSNRQRQPRREPAQGSADERDVAGFLMRCLFTMFAEDVGLLEDRAFTDLLKACQRKPVSFVPKVTELWDKMNTGGYSVVLDAQIRRFNGGLFSPPHRGGAGGGVLAIPLNEDQIQLLLEAAEADWKEVEPAIFGTLLERALNPRERHKLGAHYTPRAYVERLVQPTILEPLRKEWDGVQAAALTLANDNKNDKAILEVERFLQRLADLRVLDPACGSANFLYVTLELLKRLEGEVRNVLRDLGQGQISIGLTGATITPENMLGIELNPRAAKIAELVLWIGYLQWHLRSTGDLSDIGDPVLRDYHNIENRDAVLDWDHIEPVLDEAGEPVTRWDGVTHKTHPVTGEEVPDDAARTQVQRIVGGRATTWPEADFIVGNPPFIGTSRMREALGDGYTEAVRKAYKNVPASADFVMFWWDKAAELVRNRKTERFGLITTNSIRQTFNRRVIQHHMSQKKPLSLAFAIPDHPWVDSSDGAAVRISMTLGIEGESVGELSVVDSETLHPEDDAPVIKLNSFTGKLSSDLSVGANVSATIALLANSGLSNRGVQLSGSGFIITQEEANSLGLNSIPNLKDHIRTYLNGRDIASKSRNVLVIDLFGLDISEVKDQFPAVYQHILTAVKPERDQNRRKSVRENWWIHGEARTVMRESMKGLNRFISTVETSRNRYFVMLDIDVLPDNKLVNISLDDFYCLGVLSSRVHIEYSFASGSWLGVGNDSVYAKTRCFETFPFPPANEAQKVVIRELAERLDAHRKRQQSLHPKLTMTGMYNVLEKLRAEEPLNDKEKKIHQDGLVGILREIHDELDAAVAQAYGWPVDLPEQEILQRLVDLNAERAAEEARGHVRWLRPEYQAPDEVQGVQSEMALGDDAPVAVVAEARKWPQTLAERATALRELLAIAGEQDLSLPAVAAAFKPKLSKTKLAEAEGLLDTLVALGQAERGAGGWHVA